MPRPQSATDGRTVSDENFARKSPRLRKSESLREGFAHASCLRCLQAPPLPVDLGYNSVMKLGHLLLPGLLVGGATGCNMFFSASEDPAKDARLEQDSPNAVPMSHIARAFVRATPTAPFVTTTWQNLGSADVDITIDRGQGFVPVRWLAADAFALDVDGTTPYRLHVVEHLDQWRRTPTASDYDSTEAAVELKVSPALGRAGQTDALTLPPKYISGASVPVTAGVNNLYIASTGIWTFTLVPAMQQPDGGYLAKPEQRWQIPETAMLSGYLGHRLACWNPAKATRCC